jgi:glycosyltransferase involved in cell wall biosynthesis
VRPTPSRRRITRRLAVAGVLAVSAGTAMPLRKKTRKMSASSSTGDKARVLFVNTKTRPPLGADTWIHAQIMRDLDRSTNELWAACAPGAPDAPTPTYEVLSGIDNIVVHPVDFGTELSGRSVFNKIRTLPRSFRTLSSLAGLAALVKRRRVQIIHTSDRPRDALACVLLARLTGAKCLIHVHVGYGEWMSPLLKWSLKRADGLIAVSEFVGRTLVASGHDPRRIHVVLNAIDPDTWQRHEDRGETRREFSVPLDGPMVITVCRLFPAKGPEELLRCLPALRRVHPGVTLMIVGDEMQPGYRRHLIRVAHDLGVAESVRLAGHRSDVARLMEAADVFAMPSLGEPFGLVFLEAMSMRLPVVALDSGGTPEVVENGVTGLLSEPGDTEQLTNNLLTLLGDSEMRKRMGVAGQSRVAALFTTPRMAADTAKVYRQITIPFIRGADTLSESA